MLAGHLPFDDDNISRLLVKIKSGRYIPLPSYVSPEAKDLVKSMLVVDPAKRIKVSSILLLFSLSLCIAYHVKGGRWRGAREGDVMLLSKMCRRLHLNLAIIITRERQLTCIFLLLQT